MQIEKLSNVGIVIRVCPNSQLLARSVCSFLHSNLCLYLQLVLLATFIFYFKFNWLYLTMLLLPFHLLKTILGSLLVKEESVCAIRNLGIQVSTVMCNGQCSHKLIPMDHIQHVLIMEAPHRLQFIFYLCIHHDKNQRTILFPVCQLIHQLINRTFFPDYPICNWPVKQSSPNYHHSLDLYHLASTILYKSHQTIKKTQHNMVV